MIKSRHQPGPWHACHDGQCSCKQVWCDDYPIACVTSGNWGDDFPAVRLTTDNPLDAKAEAYMEQFTYGSIDEPLARANARLIAAAPEMHDYIASLAKRGDRKAKKIIFDLARPPKRRRKGIPRLRDFQGQEKNDDEPS